MPRYGATTADFAENNLRRRARKPRENQARNQSVCQQAVIRFDCDEQIRNQPDRMNRAVTDGRKRLHAEEKSAQKQFAIGSLDVSTNAPAPVAV